MASTRASACASKDAVAARQHACDHTVLEIDSTETVALDAKSPALLSQLRRRTSEYALRDRRRRIAASVDNNLPRLSATSYELLALPMARCRWWVWFPSRTAKSSLTTEKGTRYWIRGDLAGVLTEYAGARCGWSEMAGYRFADASQEVHAVDSDRLRRGRRSPASLTPARCRMADSALPLDSSANMGVMRAQPLAAAMAAPAPGSAIFISTPLKRSKVNCARARLPPVTARVALTLPMLGT